MSWTVYSTLLIFFVSSVPSREKRNACFRKVIRGNALTDGTVTETTQDYICTGEFHYVQSEYGIQYPDCDNYWSVQDHSVATLVDSSPDCHSPCKDVSAGRIVLTECVNITLSVICSHDIWTEFRVHFHGKLVPRPLHNPNSRDHNGAFIAVILLAAVLVACLLYAGRSFIKG